MATQKQIALRQSNVFEKAAKHLPGLSRCCGNGNMGQASFSSQGQVSDLEGDHHSPGRWITIHLPNEVDPRTVELSISDVPSLVFA